MTRFTVTSAQDFVRLVSDLPRVDMHAHDKAVSRQANLTKPVGSLGRLEELAIWIAGWQGKEVPLITKPCCLVFAGNHGVAAQGVSAYPAEVTAQMVGNFENGGAAINQLARLAGAEFKVIELELDQPTEDFTIAAAMSEAECCAAIQAGADAIPDRADFLILGEMGIGNTTSAAALAMAIFGGMASEWVGVGTGLDAKGLARKVEVVTQAIRLHQPENLTAFECLMTFGGRELAAIVGATLAARHRRIPVMLDGFITTAAAAMMVRENPCSLDHVMIGHMSAELGHKRLARELNKRPILDLDMRLGEASGGRLP